MLNELPQHINYFTPATLRQMLQDAGLTSVKVGSGEGLKWENLLGRSIGSHIADAYGLTAGKSPGDAASKPSLRTRAKSAAIQVAKSVVVSPVLYSQVKVGMNLSAFSIKPPARGH